MDNVHQDQLRRLVQDRYSEIAQQTTGGRTCCSTDCCTTAEELSGKMGYSEESLAAVPEGANMGLGCGNPHAIAQLKTGETVLDLGSGGGLDCFLASRQVGDTGRVIGVDMTPAMVSRARKAAADGAYANVEFRLGEIERLPAADQSVDVILSNCVINLSPDKPRVFREAFRVLKKGGRLAISDVVMIATLPEQSAEDARRLYVSCVAGASSAPALEAMLKEAGFSQIRIEPVPESAKLIKAWAPETNAHSNVISAAIQAIKE